MRADFLLPFILGLIAVLSDCRPESTEPQALFPKSVMDYPHQDTITSILWKADSLKWRRYYHASIDAFKHLQSTVQVPNPPGYSLPFDRAEGLAYILNQIAYCYLMLNEKDSAFVLLTEFDKSFPNLQVSEGAAADYHFNRGFHAQKAEDATASIYHLKKAVELYDSVYSGRVHLKKTLALGELGLTYRFLRSVEVNSFLYYADRSYAQLAEDSLLIPFADRIYFCQTHACWLRRDHVTGENLVERGLRIAYGKPVIDTMYVARLHSLKGKMLKKQKSKAEKARRELFRAIELGERLGTKSLEVQQLYSELLKFFVIQEDSANFFYYLSRVEEAFGPDQLVYIHPDRLLGMYYYAAGNFRLSAKWYSKFIKRYKGERQPSHQLWLEAYYLLVNSSLMVNDTEAAEKNTWHLISLYAHGDPNVDITWDQLFESKFANNRNLYNTYNLLANVYNERFKLKGDQEALCKAFELYTFIDTLIYQNIASFDEDAWLSFSRGYSSKIYSSAVETAYHLYALRRDSMTLNWANHFMERLKSPLLYREFVTNQKENFPDIPERIIDQEDTLNRAIREQKNRDSLRNEAKLEELLRRKEVFYHKLKDSFPQYYLAKIKQPFVGATEVQQCLSSGQEVVLNYLLGREYLYYLAITPDTILFERVPEGERIEVDIHKIRNFFSESPGKFGKKAIENYAKAASSLYRDLIVPIEPLLEPGYHLTIIPDDALNNFPFDVLLTNDSTGKDLQTYQYLIDQYSVSLAFSTKAFLYQKKNPLKLSDRPSILAYAYADLPGFFSAGASEIPATARELQTIRQVFPDGNLVLRYGKRSTKRHLARYGPKGFDIFHFAVHASSDENNRFNNLIYFPGNDSIFGYEIIPLRLKGKMIILTSCETATGSNEKGEGTYSLSRAFFLSGIHTVVSANWQIEDQSTSEITDSFYRHLKAGEPPHKATHLAKLDYLRSAKGHRIHPYYWAGLVCYGS